MGKQPVPGHPGMPQGRVGQHHQVRLHCARAIRTTGLYHTCAQGRLHTGAIATPAGPTPWQGQGRAARTILYGRYQSTGAFIRRSRPACLPGRFVPQGCVAEPCAVAGGGQAIAYVQAAVHGASHPIQRCGPFVFGRWQGAYAYPPPQQHRALVRGTVQEFPGAHPDGHPFRVVLPGVPRPRLLLRWPCAHTAAVRALHHGECLHVHKTRERSVYAASGPPRSRREVRLPAGGGQAEQAYQGCEKSADHGVSVRSRRRSERSGHRVVDGKRDHHAMPRGA